LKDLIKDIPTTNEPEIYEYLYCFGRDTLKGEKSVVEIGPMFGASTISLLNGTHQ
jgi:predicted O-methyltransferase YrrM